MSVRPRTSRSLTVFAISSLALPAALLSGCSSSDSSTVVTPTASASASSDGQLASFYSQRLTWGPCKDKAEGSSDKVKCAQLKVPLDYAQPDGEVISLALLKVPAGSAKQRKGSLILNPGGPGGSGVDYASYVPVSAKVAKAYDIVGFDPRGVGQSAPVTCLTPAQTDAMIAADGTPDTKAEEDDIVRISQEVADGCQAKSPSIARHMDTTSAAKDMDILRAALGDEKINYLGKSYGTYLGTTYADLFPDKVGRVVLDGVLPSGLDLEQVAHGQVLGFEDAVRRFINWCDKQDDCPLPTGEDKGYARLQKFLADLEKKPIDGVGDRKLNEALATYALIALLYFPPTSWEQLSFGLEAAFDGDGSVLLSEVDRFMDRNPDGTYASNSQDAFYAVTCLDRQIKTDAAQTKATAAAWAKDSPLFGEYLAWGNVACAEWPYTTDVPKQATATGANPILVVSTKHDPATPYEWGVEVAGQLDEARLVSFDADGHTAYLSSVGSSCVDKVVDTYLLSGEMPNSDVTCDADQ